MIISMLHKRSFETRQRKVARRLILKTAYTDRFKAETINRLSRSKLIDYISRMFSGRVHLGAIPNVEVGEILCDPRGRGSLQRGSENEG
ncbi:MAG: hypothetical protein QXH24_04065 [Candidatus Bathyarchaeia archaeon]